jgi:transcriptional regulator with XRE-family HTH domain
MALRQLREERDWSNKQLAAHLGLATTSRLGTWLTEVHGF